MALPMDLIWDTEVQERSRANLPNLKFTIGDKQELWSKVMKEVNAKRYAGPFSEIPFEYFIQSPIGLVPKDNGKKTRLIFHLSYPRNSQRSVNYNTPKELSRVHYKDFDQAIRICIKVKGNNITFFLGKSDLSNAFRNLPIKKEFWNYLVMKAQSPKDGKWYYFVDKCLPFGASISCAVFQAFSDALAHILQTLTHQENVNYLDDFLFMALLKSLCNNQLTTFLNICKQIAFPVSLDKTEWATERIVFLGLLIDARKGLICIPVAKIEAAKKLIDKVLHSKKMTKRELQQICGYLNFLGKCIVPGRAFTRRIYAHGAKLSKPHHHLNVNLEIRLDLTLWREFIENSNIFARPFFDFDNEAVYSPLDFFTDASGKLGAGGYFRNQWFIIPWDENFLEKKRPSINYLELYALTVAVLAWTPLLTNRKVIIFCDNQSVIHMVNNTTSSCKNCMVLIRFPGHAFITTQCQN